MGMYDDIVEGVSENIEIGGYPFYAESIRGEEPFNRREYSFKPILNGTLSPQRGKYIQRKFSFQTTVYHKDGRPDSHDKILAELCSGPVEVISPAMGGKFKAIVTFSKDIKEGSKYHTDYDVDVLEIPEKASNIPGENFLVVPAVQKVGKGKVASEADIKLNNQLSKCNVPFKSGQKNQCVNLLQDKLVNLGHLDKKYKTGIYDARTVEAVKSYQRSTKGKLLVDGVFGKYTLSYLIKE